MPYFPPGSPELARQTAKTVRGNDVVLMANHGQVTVGKTFDDAIQKAVFFELACDIILRSARRVLPLSSVSVAQLRRKAKV